MIRTTILPQRRLPLPEQQLDRLFEKSLTAAFGTKAWLRHSHTDKLHSTGKAFNKGEPDYIGTIHGLFVGVENKVHPNYPDDQQLAYLMKIVRSGGLAFLLVHDKRKGPEDGYYLVSVPEKDFIFSWREGVKSHWLRVPFVKYGEEGGILDLTGLHGLVSHRIHDLYRAILTRSQT